MFDGPVPFSIYFPDEQAEYIAALINNCEPCMLVRELIAYLSELDQDLPVVMPADGTLQFCEVTAALTDMIVVIDQSMFLADEREPGHRPAIRLLGTEGGIEACTPMDD